MTNYLTSANIKDLYRLSPMQEGMYFHFLMDKTSSTYFEQLSYRLYGELEVELVKKSLRQLFDRYDILRTVFNHEKKDLPLQVVLKEWPLDFHWQDLRHLPRQEKEKYLEEFRVRDRQRPFNLNKDVLMRTAVFHLEAQEYEFTWSHHHILMDGWCVGILIGDFYEIYNSLMENRSLRLPVVRPYRDYIRWLEENGDREKSCRYWRSYLEGYDEKASVPAVSGVLSPRGEYKSEHISLVLEKEKSAALKRLAADNRVTLNTLIQSVWGIVLGNYCGKTDVVFGAVVSGRPPDIPGIGSMVGLFINTIPLRIYWDDETTFIGLLEQVQREAVDSEPHHYYPLARIQAESSLKRQLLDHIMIFESYPLARQLSNKTGEKGSLKLEPGQSQTFEQTNYDFNIIVIPGEQLTVEFSFNACVYDRGTLQGTAGHLQFLLDQVLENRGAVVNRLTLLAEEERRQLLEEFNDTRADYPSRETIHRLFQEQVERTPHRTALVGSMLAGLSNPQKDFPVSLTYHELYRISRRLAGRINERGGGNQALVGLMVHRSVEMIVAILAVLEAGGIYLPIDPGFPAARVNYMLTDSGVQLLVTAGKSAIETKTLPGILDLGNTLPLLADAVDTQRAETTDNSFNPAYVIYTSGSTGKPRGVIVEHHSVINRLNWMQRCYPLGAGHVILQKTTVVFDVSVWELFWWSHRGGGLCLLPPGGEKDPGVIVEIIERYRISIIHFVPSMLKVFLEYLDCTGYAARLGSIRYVFTSGESLEVHQVDKFRELLGYNKELKLINLYGPTEATVDVTYFNVPLDRQSHRVPIGKPIDNTWLYILKRDFHLQPVGVTGELFIAGAGVARGYLNRPELTAERFVMFYRFDRSGSNHSPLTIHHSPIYKTGDLARWLPDGNIEFQGRIDQQIKLRGLRIEPAEIENQLMKIEYIKDAVVVARNEEGENRLCVYYVSEDGFDKIRGRIVDIRDRLSQALPAYMVPSYYVRLESLPRLTNGKINRGALPAPTLEASENQGIPRDKTEQALARVWSEVLKLNPLHIGIHSDFFHLGGHSLNAISMISKVNKTLGVKLALSTVFKYSTLGALAGYIKKMPGNNNKYVGVEPVEERDYYVISPAQKRMYWLRQLDPRDTAYNLPHIKFFQGAAQRRRWETSLRQLIHRHDSLRTSFLMADNQVVQRVHPPAGRDLTFSLEGGGLSGEVPGDPVRDFIRDFVRPFDLNLAPLLRAAIVQIHPDEYILLVDMHHIISDGVSTMVLVEEFTALYQGERLPRPRLQYKDYVRWQEKESRGEALLKQRQYWLEIFAGEIPHLHLPTDFSRPPIKTYAGGIVQFELTRQETLNLHQVAENFGGTMFTVLLGLYNILLFKLTGQHDHIVGTPEAGRPYEDLEKIVGMFVNTIALRNTISSEMTCLDFLKEVRENVLQALENRDYPFEELVGSLPLPRDTGRHPLFDTMLVFQSQGAPTLHLALSETTVQPDLFDLLHKTSKFDITWNAVEADGQLYFTIEYSTRLFRAGTVEQFSGYFKRIVTSVIAQPGQKPGSIEMITPEEKQKITAGFNATAAPFPHEKTLHGIFRDQAAASPDGAALVEAGTGRILTYEELDKRSRRLADYLLRNGIKPEEPVAILMERSIEMMVGIFAALRAGGAYLPLDPHYPAARKNFILDDAGVKIILTRDKTGINDNGSREIIALQSGKWESPGPARPGHNHSSAGLAYIIYTSGSTGGPKGVMVSHRSVVNRLNWMQKKYPLGRRDVILQKTPVTFDVSVWELFWWHLAGASLCLLPPGGEKVPALILEVLTKYAVSVIHFVPPMLEAFLQYLEGTGIKGGIPGLSLIFSSGEALEVHHFQRYKDLLPAGRDIPRLVNLYGPTEATVDVSYFETSSQEDYKLIPIGKPIDNTRILILDREFRLQPIGIPGQLCIAGVGLARGYLNRPGLTAEKFVIRHSSLVNSHWSLVNDSSPKLSTNDRCPMTNDRFYKTGDLAQWQPDGNIRFLGRIDHQVKIRGYRIEVEEIQRHLLEIDGIDSAVVVDREDPHGHRYLCAYISTGNNLQWLAVRNLLLEKLPEYMVPTRFMRLDSIPLNPSGKVNRAALPPPTGEEEGLGTPYAPPRDEIEAILVQAWQEVLARQRIGIHDHFFMIGGDSIKIIQVVARLHKSGYKLEMGDFFHSPTIARLAPYVKQSHQTVPQDIVRGRVLLTPIQANFFSGRAGNRHHYNQSLLLASSVYLEETAVQAVFEKTWLHHDALRMVFRCEKETVIQFNQGKGRLLPPQVCDLRGQPDALEELEKQCAEIQGDMSLEKGPLIRLGLFHLEDGDRLLIVIHHLVVDGISWRILLEDIRMLFRQYRQGHPLELPPKTHSYQYWAEKLSAYARDSKTLEAERHYWQKLFSTKVSPLPRDFEGENIFKYRQTHWFQLNNAETEALLTRVNAAYNTEINDILLTGLGLAIKKTFGNSLLGISLEGHGREEIFKDIDLTRTVGWFTCIYPVILDMSYHDDLSRQVIEVKETLRRVPKKGVGYGILKYLSDCPLVEQDGINRDQVLFNYLGQFDTHSAPGDFLQVTGQSGGSPIGVLMEITHDIEINAIISDGYLRVSVSYSIKQYKKETVQALTRHYQEQLKQVISHCSSRGESRKTPGDFTYKGLSTEKLEKIQSLFKKSK